MASPKVLGSTLQDIIPSEKVTASFKTYLLEVAIRSHSKLQGNRELFDAASSLRAAVLHRPSYSAMTSQPAVRSPAPQHRPSSVGTAATPCSHFTAGCVGRPFAHHRHRNEGRLLPPPARDVDAHERVVGGNKCMWSQKAWRGLHYALQPSSLPKRSSSGAQTRHADTPRIRVMHPAHKPKSS